MTWHELGSELPRSGTRFTRWLGRTAVHVIGWRVEGQLPNRAKLIIAVAPHSSNFDFVLTVLIIWGAGLRASFLAKDTLFRFPLSILMNHFGGIPVDRSAKHGVVEQMAGLFGRSERLVLGITPEGTRSQVTRMKHGFAQIAAAADVPVQPAILDYRRKVVRFLPVISDVSSPDVTVAQLEALAATGVTRAHA